MKIKELFEQCKVGDTVKLRYDDEPRNQEIIGKPVKVTKVLNTGSPNWIEVEHNGKKYTVRGNDCDTGI